MFKSNANTNDQINDDSTVRVIQLDIVKSDLNAKALIQDIRDCTGPVEVLNTLNMEISGNMKSMKSAIDELETLAREQESEADKHRVLKEVEKYHKLYAANQFALRKANIACQALIERQNKEELFERTASGTRKRIRADKENLAKQSSSITESLVAISNMMSSQVKQSEEALHTLVNSSSQVQDTGEEFKTMGNVIHQSKSLLQKYGRREVTDRVLIVLATLFFFACIFYVIQKRLF